MKKLTFALTFLACMMTTSSTYSQCLIPNGDFNTWYDAAEDYDNELGIIPDTTKYLAEGWIPFLRPFTLLFADVLVGALGADSLAYIDNYFGVQRYTVDIEMEDYAICLQPDSFLTLADVAQVFFCEDEPDQITFDLKHIGSDADTLTVIYIQGESDVIATALGDLTDPASQGVTAYGFGKLGGGPADWTSVSLNIQQFDDTPDDPAIVDTAILWIIADTDSLSVAMGTSKYFIDNLIKVTNVTPVAVVEQEAEVSISPNPTTDYLRLQVPDANSRRYSLYSIEGQLIKQDEFRGDMEISVRSLAPGWYSLQIRNQQGQLETHRFVKQ